MKEQQQSRGAEWVAERGDGASKAIGGDEGEVEALVGRVRAAASAEYSTAFHAAYNEAK